MLSNKELESHSYFEIDMDNISWETIKSLFLLKFLCKFIKKLSKSLICSFEQKDQ